MTHRILLLHRLDMAAASLLASQLLQKGELREAPVITVLDPVLHTYACINGMPDAQLLQLPGYDDDAPEAAARALASARLMTGQADELMAELIPEARGAAWLTFWLRMLLTTVYACRGMARALAKQTVGDTVHLLLPDQPHRYGYHSFMPGLVINEGLRAAGQSPRLYVNPLPPHDAPMLPDPMTAPVGLAVGILCHIPTCFADSALFSAELQASGQAVLVMPSQVYDVVTDPLPRCGLVPSAVLAARLPAPQRAALDAVLDRLGGVLTQHLGLLVSGAGMVQKQVVALVEAYRMNALLFFAMQAHFADRPPKTMVLSNHDVGLHGALVSFARRHRMHTVMVPHAKIFNGVVASYGHDILCLTHPLQGGEVIDLDGYRMPTGTLDFAKTLQVAAVPPKPLATLGVALNAVSANAISLVDMHSYLPGLRQLLDWCATQRIECRIRCRPNGSAFAMLCTELGLKTEELLAHQAGSMVEYAQGCDLVLCYDIPTSGAFDLLDQGIPVAQVLCRRLEPEHCRMADARVLPRWPVAETLQQLARFKTDPLALWRFRHTQICQRARAGEAALPLRAWL